MLKLFKLKRQENSFFFSYLKLHFIAANLHKRDFQFILWISKATFSFKDIRLTKGIMHNTVVLCSCEHISCIFCYLWLFLLLNDNISGFTWINLFSKFWWNRIVSFFKISFDNMHTKNERLCHRITHFPLSSAFQSC